jgi:glycosyltransferase involved in cell wall biosynthesis
MNILILTHSYPDANYNWQGIFIKEQAEAISLNHDVTVVYFKVDYSHFSPFAKYHFSKRLTGNLTEYEVTIKKSFPVISQIKYLYNTYRFLENEIFSNKEINIIHSHLSYPAGFLGTLIQKKKKIPNIITEHTWIDKYFRSHIHKQCVLFALKRTSCVVSVSNALKTDIALYCHRPVVVIPNVVVTEKFPLSKTKTGKILNIGLLGGMGNKRKGLDILLTSASLLQNRNFFIHIGGDGILLNTYKMMAKDFGIEDKCKFYGDILPGDVVEFYSRLEVFVLASRDETFGVVVIEAMACGLPVIATRCGGPEEIITRETGVLVEKENPVELAKAIDYISENIGLYDKPLIRKYAQERYDQKVFIESIAQLYKQIAPAT